MKTALLVIDIQNIYTNQDSELFIKNSAQVVENVNKLINYFERQNQQIIYIKHIDDINNLGRMYDFSGQSEAAEFLVNTEVVDYDESLKVVNSGIEIIKHRYDAFVGTNLEQVLVQNQIEKVVICGFMANFCCESTARSAHDRDFYVDYVKDAVGALEFENNVLESTTETLSNGFAKVMMTKDILK